MEIAHLILAHNGPKQLYRLVKRLVYPGADIYIHLDKKTEIKPFREIISLPNVYFIEKRVKVRWGSYSMITATINAFEEIIATGKTYKFVNLISGQDYPLRPQSEFHDYLTNHPDSAFMHYLIFETHWQEALSRINQYHFNNFSIKGKFFFQRIVNRLLPERTFPLGLIAVGRSQWFTLPIEHITYIVEHWEENAKLRRFIRLTWAPDEFLFQTILYNSKFKDKIVNDNLRFMKWAPAAVSPDTLTEANAEEILQSGCFFARKFNESTDSRVLDIIDERALDVKG